MPRPSQHLSTCSPSWLSPNSRLKQITAKRVFLATFIIATLAWGLGLAAVLLPEWTVEDANVQSTLDAHIGLFETIYHVGEVRESSTPRFCNGLGPMYSTEKCVWWRISQITALLSLGMGYTGVLLLFLVIGSSWIRPQHVYSLAAWVWNIFLFAGVCGIGSAAAWNLLVLAFLRDHRELQDGYSVHMGLSMFVMAAMGAVFISLPLWRMVFERCILTWSSSSGTLAGRMWPFATRNASLESAGSSKIQSGNFPGHKSGQGSGSGCARTGNALVNEEEGVVEAKSSRGCAGARSPRRGVASYCGGNQPNILETWISQEIRHLNECGKVAGSQSAGMGEGKETSEIGLEEGNTFMGITSPLSQ